MSLEDCLSEAHVIECSVCRATRSNRTMFSGVNWSQSNGLHQPLTSAGHEFRLGVAI